MHLFVLKKTHASRIFCENFVTGFYELEPDAEIIPGVPYISSKSNSVGIGHRRIAVPNRRLFEHYTRLVDGDPTSPDAA
jgi:hypothetical protein